MSQPQQKMSDKSRGNKRGRVFIIDDHPVVRDGLKSLLANEPDLMICGEAADSAGALSAIPQASPDVILLDLSLEHGSGLDLLKDLAIRHSVVPVLVLSMHDEVVYAERAVRAGARGYLMKGESSERVVSAVRSVLSGKVWLSERAIATIAGRLGRGQETRPPIEQLSDRELEVFQMIGQGCTTGEIAERIHVSIKTVQAYVARAKEKFGVASSRELMREAMRWTESQTS